MYLINKMKYQLILIFNFNYGSFLEKQLKRLVDSNNNDPRSQLYELWIAKLHLPLTLRKANNSAKSRK